MSVDKIGKLARMANQIGEAQAVLPSDEAAKAVASHIRKYWTPKMIAETLAALERGQVAMNETAAHGFAILQNESVKAS